MSEEIKNIIAEVELTLDITIKPMVLFQRQHIKQLLDLITNLQTQLQQKENIIKEVREKVHNIYFRIDNIPQNHWIGIKLDTTNQGQELLKILDKENK